MIKLGDILCWRTSNPWYKLLNKYAAYRYPLFRKWMKENNFYPWHFSPVVGIKEGQNLTIYDTYDPISGGVAPIKRGRLYDTIPTIVKTLDANLGGAKVREHHIDYIKERCKCYRWLSKTPVQEDVDYFVEKYTGKKYDIGACIASAFYLLTGVTGRWVDDQYHCQELTARFALEFGSPLLPMWSYPVHPRLLPILEKYEVEI